MARLRVPGHVRQGLAEHDDELVGDLGGQARAAVGHARARPLGRDLDAHLRGEAQDRRRGLRLGAEPVLDRRRVRVGRRVQGEDGRADLPDRLVEVGDGLLDAGPRVRVGDERLHAHERHRGREQALDHHVVQVARDAVAVLEHAHLLGAPVEPRVLDRDARGRGERDDGRLVLGRELRRGVLAARPGHPLVREVQVAEHRLAHPDRDAEERVHRRVPLGEARRADVVGDLRHADGLRVVDELAEQPLAVRPVVDRGDLVVREAQRDELREALAARGVEHAQRPVPGTGQLHGRLDDAPQHLREVEVARHRHDGVQHALPDGGRQVGRSAHPSQSPRREAPGSTPPDVGV